MKMIKFYRVKWFGYPDEVTTLEPEKNIRKLLGWKQIRTKTVKPKNKAYQKVD